LVNNVSVREERRLRYSTRAKLRWSARNSPEDIDGGEECAENSAEINLEKEIELELYPQQRPFERIIYYLIKLSRAYFMADDETPSQFLFALMAK
jgi:hypothetical protein